MSGFIPDKWLPGNKLKVGKTIRTVKDYWFVSDDLPIHNSDRLVLSFDDGLTMIIDEDFINNNTKGIGLMSKHINYNDKIKK